MDDTEKKTAVTAFDRARTTVAPDVEERFAPRALTPRKRRMVQAYVETGTIAAAARAGGMNDATAKKLLEKDADVRRAVSELVDRAANVTGITLERVLEEYGRLAFSDIGALIDVLQSHSDPDAALAIIADLPADMTAAISKIELSRKITDEGFETGNLKLHMHDKKSALSDLGRMLSVFNDKLTIVDESEFGERLNRALAKLEGLANE